MLTNIRSLNEPMYYRYSYDQLNRIKSMNAYRGQDAAANGWPSPQATADYQEQVSYDPNGNIMSCQRNGRTIAMDNLSYSYTANTNKLRHVTDAVAAGNYSEDLDNQALVDNFTYDLIGNLKSDAQEGIGAISWTVYGKIRQITKGTTTIVYRYDASGNRISKAVTIGSTTTTTYYVRDAQGNVMAVYEKQAADTLRWTEQHLYGSSRLGMWTFGQAVPAATTAPAVGSTLEDGYIHGTKFFELANHLGNVLATVSDKKIGVDEGNNGTTDYFNVEVVSAQDYYPFGMVMPDRKFAAPSSSYRYGFNGKENDKDISEGGQDYGMRIYDSRLGRFLSVDPLTKDYPELTPYQFASNTPIAAIDLDGTEAKLIITTEITGYSIQQIYGSKGRPTPTYIVVPTYKAILVDAQNPSATIGTYNVTRDAWYSRGYKDESKWEFWKPNDGYRLVNRAFEPADANVNLYTGVPSQYVGGDSYVLSQKSSARLNAAPFTTEQNTYLDGTNIDDARADLNKASGVMVHIAGWYDDGSGVPHLAGSYGCFGFIPIAQVSATESDAQNKVDNNTVGSSGTSNSSYQTFLNAIMKIRQKYKGTPNDKLLIEVKKREEVDTTRNVEQEKGNN